ncbi:transposase [Portibacter marinus]|uniref:transposase n=1 Tax=Portibacter marinus TaxID=2898660 RepID=UPI001F2E5A6C|nr:transposase [Portibacter marinus]
MQELKQYYKQRLPHIQPIGATFFVTFRLHGSIHNSVIRELSRNYQQAISKAMIKYSNPRDTNSRKYYLKRRLVVSYDRILDNREAGPRYLQEHKIAKICMREILKHNDQLYHLIACTIMSNHIHLLIDTSVQIPPDGQISANAENFTTLDQIMKKIKGSSAFYANKQLSRSGKFWGKESFDIYIRNEKMLSNVIRYILQNPVKAGIVEKASDFEHSYLSPEYGEMESY